MRLRIPPQRDLFAPRSEFKRAKELKEANRLLAAHPEWEEWVHADLTRKRRVTSSRGRRGLPARVVLRVGILKHLLGVSMRELAHQIADSVALREFLGIPLADPTPTRSTLQRNTRMIQQETWARLFRGLLDSEELREFESGEKVRTDATVVPTNIHYPSDSALLWDGVRVLSRTMRRASEAFAEVEYEDLSKAVKRQHTKIYWARRKAQRTPAYERLLDAARKVSAQVEGVVAALTRVTPRSVTDYALVQGLTADLEHFGDLLARVIDQTERRVLNGEKVPAAEKVFSVFEPHTDMITKGSQTLFGHKTTFTMSQHFVLDAVIERGNPVDVTLAVRQLERQEELFGRAPSAAAFDGGYASGANLEAARKLGVERCAFSKPRGLSPEEMAGSRRSYGRLKRFRAGIEGKISWLKRDFGLGRCTWKGWDRFQSYVWSACFAANLQTLVRLRLKDKKKRAAAERRRSAA